MDGLLGNDDGPPFDDDHESEESKPPLNKGIRQPTPKKSWTPTIPIEDNGCPHLPGALPGGIPAVAPSFDGAALSDRWLCPIQSDYERRGILQMAAAEYFELVDKSGRMTRSDKRGEIDAKLAPILMRIGANPEAWLETVSCFGSKYRLSAGLLFNLRKFADQLGRRWLKGVTAARAAFASSPPQLA